MWSFCLFVATISLIYGQTLEEVNNYQDLGADLPLPLGQHITGVYNNYLYVFGGKNSSGSNSDDDEFNDRFWRLPLSSIQLSGTNDITSSLTSASWEEVSVTAPSYGISSTDANQFACVGQCYAQVGQYLYIIGAATSTTNDVLSPNDVIYRLDLSQDPPVFAGESDFVSTTGYLAASYGQCVTSIDDVLYTVGGNSITGGNQQLLFSYTPSSNTQTALVDIPSTNSNFYAGCAGGSTTDNKLWLLGGGVGSNPTLPSVYVSDYDITSGEWTTRSFNSPGAAFDTGKSGTNTRSRGQTKCLTSRYADFIECAGGFGAASYDTAVIYDNSAYVLNGASANSYSDLSAFIKSAGFNSISLLEDTTNYVAAELMIVTGGFGGSSDTEAFPPALATVQYAVRYSSLPGPSLAPTESPSKDPSQSPTLKPTQDPTCAGCTRAPSTSPTTAMPTVSPIPTEDPTKAPVDDTTGGNSAGPLCVIVSIVLALISVIIV